MAVSAAAVTVTTSATALNVGDADGQSVEVYNNGAATVWYGGAGVTTASGVPIALGTSRVFDLSPGEVVYAVAASGTVECRVAQIGVG